MHSFELKIAIEAAPERIFRALVEPQWMVKWDSAAWILNDICPGGRLRKRDEEGSLTEGEIVVYDPPRRFGYLWPVAEDPEELEDDVFLVRYEFITEDLGDKSILTLTGVGFPTEELADRDKNSWGGYYLEKIKKVAESIPARQSSERNLAVQPGQVRHTELATTYR